MKNILFIFTLSFGLLSFAADIPEKPCVVAEKSDSSFVAKAMSAKRYF